MKKALLICLMVATFTGCTININTKPENTVANINQETAPVIASQSGTTEKQDTHVAPVAPNEPVTPVEPTPVEPVGQSTPPTQNNHRGNHNDYDHDNDDYDHKDYDYDDHDNDDDHNDYDHDGDDNDHKEIDKRGAFGATNAEVELVNNRITDVDFDNPKDIDNSAYERELEKLENAIVASGTFPANSSGFSSIAPDFNELQSAFNNAIK